MTLFRVEHRNLSGMRAEVIPNDVLRETELPVISKNQGHLEMGDNQKDVHFRSLTARN